MATRDYSPLASLGKLNLGEVSDEAWDEVATMMKEASRRVRAGKEERRSAEILEFAVPHGHPLRIKLTPPPDPDDAA
jgi:hypothetical protein